MRRVAAVLLFALALAGCSLLLDLDPLQGHPCDDAGACLPGYECKKGVCVSLGGDGGGDGGGCPSGQTRDPDAGTCAFDCGSLVCPTGDACDAMNGCVPVQSGLGQPCSTDADCAGLLAACGSTADCLCLLSAAGGGSGVCVGLPLAANDCGACSGAACVDATFSSGGTNGAPSAHKLCVPPGFATCSTQADCAPATQDVVCTYAALASDTADPTTGLALGTLGVCSAPTGAASLARGDPCNPTQPDACPTGLCLPMGNGQTRCTTPCRTDSDCGNNVAACVRGPVDVPRADGTSVYDVAAVCGVGFTLGTACDTTLPAEQWSCATDAPACVNDPLVSQATCSRPCKDDGDCEPASRNTCVKTGTTGGLGSCLRQ